LWLQKVAYESSDRSSVIIRLPESSEILDPVLAVASPAYDIEARMFSGAIMVGWQ